MKFMDFLKWVGLLLLAWVLIVLFLFSQCDKMPSIEDARIPALIEQVKALGIKLDDVDSTQQAERRAEKDSLSSVIETLKDSMFARIGGSEEKLHNDLKALRQESAVVYGGEIAMLEDSIRDIKGEQAALKVLMFSQDSAILATLKAFRDSLARLPPDTVCDDSQFHTFTVNDSHFGFSWDDVIDIDDQGAATEGVTYEVTMSVPSVVAVDQAGNRSTPTAWDGLVK